MELPLLACMSVSCTVYLPALVAHANALKGKQPFPNLIGFDTCQVGSLLPEWMCYYMCITLLLHAGESLSWVASMPRAFLPNREHLRDECKSKWWDFMMIRCHEEIVDQDCIDVVLCCG